MFLTKFALSRPIVVRMALILIMAFGVYSYWKMPKYMDPDITIGEGLVVTLCPGFSPEEMEKLVTSKIEDELEGIAEIRRYESNSYESTSKIHVFFNTRLSEYEIDQAMQEIRNAVDRVEDLPKEAKVPRVIEIDIALFPVCMVGLSGQLPMMQLQDIAEEISETFETINHAIKQSSLSRWEIAGAMSAFVGVEITKFMLDSWTAESKDGHRFPAIYVPAFCRAAEDTASVRMLAEKSGICAVPGREVILAEVAKRMQRRDNETREIKKLKLLLEQIS